MPTTAIAIAISLAIGGAAGAGATAIAISYAPSRSICADAAAAHAMQDFSRYQPLPTTGGKGF
jgi:hypothetical protein